VNPPQECTTYATTIDAPVSMVVKSSNMSSISRRGAKYQMAMVVAISNAR